MRIAAIRALRKIRDQNGQSLVEYALILTFIAMVAFLMLRSIGTKTNKALEPVPTALQ